jgi:hypothetical protein
MLKQYTCVCSWFRSWGVCTQTSESIIYGLRPGKILFIWVTGIYIYTHTMMYVILYKHTLLYYLQPLLIHLNIYLPITHKLNIFSERHPYMIDSDVCVHSPNDLNQLHTQGYCFSIFNILTLYFYKLLFFLLYVFCLLMCDVLNV